MQIELIGTGSIGAKQTSACTLIDEQILIDMPNGIIKKLKQTSHDVLKIKKILITHLHGDHFLYIPFFMLEKYFYKSAEKTIIYCPIGTEKKVKEIFEIVFPGDYDKINKFINIEFFEFEELKEENLLNDIFVNLIIVEHDNLKPAYGFIIKEKDKAIGFSGDSRLCEAIEKIVEESYISVLDMSFAESGNNAHMGLNDIEKLCNKYNDKTIISTHMHDYTRTIAKEKLINNLIVPDDGYCINI